MLFRQFSQFKAFLNFLLFWRTHPFVLYFLLASTWPHRCVFKGIKLLRVIRGNSVRMDPLNVVSNVETRPLSQRLHLCTVLGNIVFVDKFMRF